jgi:ORF6N domain-containing protein
MIVESVRAKTKERGQKRKTSQSALVRATGVDAVIRVLRGERVILDSDLAVLYGVSTSALNQAVKRNRERFPGDFMFALTTQEASALKSQSVISNGRGGRRRSLPAAFTEQGVAMLSSVLHSPRAIVANIEIMRAFVRLRRFVLSYADLTRKLQELERKYDAQFQVVFDAIRALMEPPPTPRRRIGFHPKS